MFARFSAALGAVAAAFLLATILGTAAAAAAPSSSGDGRYVAFESALPLGLADDTNGALDAFVYDRETDSTVRVSNAWTGSIVNGTSSDPALSADGAWVAFVSTGRDVVPTDGFAGADVFRARVGAKEATVVSLAPKGKAANKPSGEPTISRDGSSIAFVSAATNLAGGDTNRKADVFLWTATGKALVLVTRGLQGKPANGASSAPSISADGRYVAFASLASNLVAGDRNGKQDIFVYDTRTKRIALVSRPVKKGGKAGVSSEPQISANGGFVSFVSTATNLDPKDRKPAADAYVAPRASGAVRAVTTGQLGPIDQVTISPDGSTIAFRARKLSLYTAPRAKGGPKLVPGSTGASEPAFAGSAGRLVMRPAGSGPIALVDTATGAVTTVQGNGRAATDAGGGGKSGATPVVTNPVSPLPQNPVNPAPNPAPGGPSAIPQPEVMAAPAPGPKPPAAPQPESIDVPDTTGGTTDPGTANAFLYGASGIQTGVNIPAMKEERAATVHGSVLRPGGLPIGGVEVTVLDHPEFGRTASQSTGEFDMAVNGGGPLTLVFAREGYLPSQRTVDVPWNGQVEVEPVQLTPYSDKVVELDLTSGDAVQVALGETTSDADGARQPALMLERGTTATMTLQNGTEVPLDEDALRIRATEYTVGTSGDEAMPGALPATTAYTYAVEYSVDQAAANPNAESVEFSKPVATYTDNFLEFPVGTAVPAGYFDRERGEWMPSKNGIVIKVVAEANGMASVDMTGDGAPETTYGVHVLDDAERQRLAQLYAPGDSLWRVEVEHFTPWDYNFPYVLPEGAAGPELPVGDASDSGDGPEPPDPCNKKGSIIQCQSQQLGERVPIAGTQFSLVYDSGRTPAHLTDRQITVPLLAGATLPPNVTHVDVAVTVAGEVIRDEAHPHPTLDHTARLTAADATRLKSLTYTWDGLDFAGRRVLGTQQAQISVGYVYPLRYAANPQTFSSSFGGLGRGRVIGNRTTQTAQVAQSWTRNVTAWDNARKDGLGMWTINAHHTYDPEAREVKLGTGETLGAEAVNTRVIKRIAGDGSSGDSGDGGAAKAAKTTAQGIEIAPDGSIFLAEGVGPGEYGTGPFKIRRIDPDGQISTVASGQDDGYAPNPPVNATMSSPAYDMEMGPDGLLYWSNGYQIMRLNADGATASRVLGTSGWTTQEHGFSCFEDPHTPYVSTHPNDPRCWDMSASGFAASLIALAIAPDGTFYAAYESTGEHEGTGDRIYRFNLEGTVSLFAGGGGAVSGFGPAGVGGEDVSALDARFGSIVDIDVAPDGSLVVFDDGSKSVRRIGADGRIRTIGGTLRQTGLDLINDAASTDGADATTVELEDVTGGEVADDGTVYVSSLYCQCVLRIDPAGTLLRVAGAIDDEFHAGPFADEAEPARNAKLRHPIGLAVDHEGRILFADVGENLRGVYRIESTMPGRLNDTFSILSPDGAELWTFDEDRHVKTSDAVTGATFFEFAYDDAGQLESIKDRDGRVTLVTRTAAGGTITAPGGAETDLEFTTGAPATTIRNPMGGEYVIQYSANGRMTSFRTPAGVTSRFSWDDAGRLVKDETDGGVQQTLARTKLENGYRVTVRSNGGEQTSYTTVREMDGSLTSTVTDPMGGETTTTLSTDGVRTIEFPDGRTSTATLAPDPRFGMQGAFAARVVDFIPDVGTKTTLRTRDWDADTGVIRDQIRVNDKPPTVIEWDPGLRKMTTTTPEGRSSHVIEDEWGRPVTVVRGPGVEPIQTTYLPRNHVDNGRRGQIATLQQGAQVWTFGHDQAGRVTSRTDAKGDTVSYQYDAMNRVTSVRIGAEGARQYAYDADGRRTRVAMPDGSIHSWRYDGAGRPDLYTAPDGATTYGRSYTSDGKLDVSTPKAGAAIDNGYDSAGRLTSTDMDADGTVEFGFSDTTDRWASMTRTGGATTLLEWDGPLQTRVQTFDALAAPDDGLEATSWWDQDFQLTSQYVSAGVQADNLTMTRDADGLLTQYGPSDALFSLDRTGAIAGTAKQYVNNDLTMDIARDTHVRFTGRAMTLAGAAQPQYDLDVTYDEAGRITSRTEIVDGDTVTWAYTYDAAGRLTASTRNGAPYEAYSYDDNGNRTAATVDATSWVDTYDEQDRITHRDGVETWTWDASGHALTAHGLTLDYSRRGELKGVTTAGDDVAYTSDALGRRSSRTVVGDPATYTQYLYGNPGDPFQLTASRKGSELTQYYYDEEGFLFAFKQGLNMFYVASDQVGSPVAVFAQDGTKLRSWTRDSFGRVTASTGTGPDLPIGFAGGLEDPVTGLVRFGLRDYDPESGRWLARDPSSFDGSPDNLYGYVGNNPISLRDPSGLSCIGASIYLGVGAGFQLCNDGQGGWSSCVEGGVGIGGGVEVSPFGGLADPGMSTFAEVGGSIGPVGFSSSLERDDKCGKLKLGAKVGVGPVSAAGENTWGSDSPNQWQPSIAAGDIGVKAQSKAGKKGCVQF